MQIQKVAFTINETLQITGLGRSRLYREIAEGRLRIAKSGRRTLVTAEALQIFLKLIEVKK
ncbi:MAG: helix-turn-helix domain-containing protein [Holophagaceae bacterium]|nr:helix-turn-helix domain-containing protein [Holophagaceae bacterium]